MRSLSSSGTCQDGDEDRFADFFLRHPGLKKGDFYRDTIIEKIDRQERVEASQTQFDTDALSDYSLIEKVSS